MMSKRKSHNKLLPCRAASCLQSSLVSVVVSVAVLSSAGFDYPVVSSCRANETKPEIEKQLGERDLGTWQAVGSYPDDGLSPLYVTTVDSIQTIIATQPSAVILPRSIGRVELSQSGMPCFQMHCGDSYYLNRNDILWAASQEHGGNFRLFYDANLVAMSHNAKQFLISFGFGGREIFDGDTWEKYSPMTGGLPTSGAMTFGPEGWPYFILDGRIYRKQRDRWTLQKIGSMQTRWAEITSNSNGQIFARSKPDEEGVLLFALHNGEEWRSCDVPQSDLSNGSYHLCDSGMIVVVSPEHVQVFDHRDLRPYDWTIASSKKYQDSIVIPNENCVYFVGLSNASEPRPEGNCSEVVLHVMRLTFQDCHFKSRQFSQVVKTVSVSAETTDPSTRAIDQKTNSHDLRGGSTNPSIAHRVRPQKPAAALPNHRITLVARPKGGIVIQVKGLGVFSVDDSNPNAETITELDLPTIVHSRAGILGCDIHDMIYFSLPTQGMSLKASSGDRSFMACAIVPQNMVPFTELVESGRSFANSGVDQFVNTSEGLLFIASSNETAYQPQSAPSPRISRANQSANTAGQMLIWKPSKREPCLLDDRLVSIDQLIPGRDGAVIAIYADGHAALIHKAKVIAYEYSLAYLTTEHFDLMLELAPTNPCDTRFSNRVTLPLMSTGKTIWFNDSEGNLHRVTSGDKPPELIQTFGPTELVGRLHDGTLLVRPKASDGRLGGKRGDLREWSWIIQPGAEDYLLIGPNPRDLVLLKGSHVIACGEITEMIEWHSDAFCKAFGPGVPIIAPAFGNRQAWEVDIVSNEKEVWLVKAGLPRTLHIYTDGTWISAQETFARLSRDSGGTIYLWPGPRHEYICAIDPYHDDSQLYLASLDDNGELQAELLPRPRFFRGSKFVREGDEATWTSPGQSVVQRLDKDGNVARFTRRGIVSLCDQKGNLWFTYPYGTTTADVSVREVKKNQEGEVELATVKTIELPGVRTLEVEQLPDGSYLAAIRLPSSNYEEDRESYEALLWFTLDEHLDIKDSKQYLISRTPQRSVSINASWSYNPQGFLVVYAPSTERDVRDCTILTPQR